MSSVCRYSVVCTDDIPVVANIRSIFDGCRFVTKTSDSKFCRAWSERQRRIEDDFNVMVFGARDNCVSNPRRNGAENLFFRDRFRCSKMQLLYPASTVWSINDKEAVDRNQNHIRYDYNGDVKAVGHKLDSPCLLMVCDYVNRGSADLIVAFMDFLMSIATSKLSRVKRLISDQSLAIFPNRLVDRELQTAALEHFEIRYISKEECPWYAIGEEYDHEFGTLGHNETALYDLGAVPGLEFAVFQRRLERSLLDDASQCSSMCSSILSNCLESDISDCFNEPEQSFLTTEYSSDGFLTPTMHATNPTELDAFVGDVDDLDLFLTDTDNFWNHDFVDVI